jgi:hypothetical protein
MFNPEVLMNQDEKDKFKQIAGAFLQENALKPLSGGENTL